MRFFIALSFLLAACGHRAEFELTRVVTARDGDRSSVSLDVRCKLEVGTSCKSFGRLCVTAEWIDRGVPVGSTTTCHANTLRQGDTQPVRIVSDRAVPVTSDVHLRLGSPPGAEPAAVYVLPRAVIPASGTVAAPTPAPAAKRAEDP